MSSHLECDDWENSGRAFVFLFDELFEAIFYKFADRYFSNSAFAIVSEPNDQESAKRIIAHVVSKREMESTAQEMMKRPKEPLTVFQEIYP